MIVDISSEVLRVFLGVVLPPRTLVIHQVLQAVLQYLVDNKCPGWENYAKEHAKHLR